MAAIALAASLVVAPAASASTTISVNCDHQALQPKIMNAAPGSTLLLTGTCHGNFTVSKDLTMKGNPTATLDADQSGTTLSIPDPHTVHLRSLVVTGGVSPEFGAGIHLPSGGTLMLDGVTVQGNVSFADGVTEGGGIWARGTAVIRHSTIEGNQANANGSGHQTADGAGVYGEDGSLTISDSLIRGNKAHATSSTDQADAAGAGIFSINSSLAISSSTLKGNRATASGATAFVDAGGVDFHRTSSAQQFAISGSHVVSNVGSASTTGSSTPDADVFGGGLDVVSMAPDGNPLTVSHSTFQGNKVDAQSDSGRVVAEGGGIYFNDEGSTTPTLRVSSSQVTDSQVLGTGSTTAKGEGGGIEALGRLTVGRSTISGNTLTVSSGSDAATAAGGGIESPQLGTTTISATTIDGNTISAQSTSSAAGAGGGGIGTNGTANLVLKASTVSENDIGTTAQGASSEALGGGLDLESSSADDRIVNSTIYFNQASATGQSSPDAFGGGIEVVDHSLIVHLATMVANNAHVNGDAPFAGGGNLDVEPGTTTTREGTIVDRGDVYTTSGGGAMLKGLDCLGTVGSDGYNIIGTTSFCTFNKTSTDQTNLNLQLGDFGDHGGPTETVALPQGSQAVDQIPTTDCHTVATKDQRFVLRPQGPECDVGAFELKA